MPWRVNGVNVYHVKGTKQRGKGRKRKNFSSKNAARKWIKKRGRK